MVRYDIYDMTCHVAFVSHAECEFSILTYKSSIALSAVCHCSCLLVHAADSALKVVTYIKILSAFVVAIDWLVVNMYL